MTVVSQHVEQQHGQTHEEAQDGDVVMMFYFLADKSTSMQDVMPQLNDALRSLKQLAVDNPDIADVVQVSVIAFDHEARVVVPMGPLQDATMPTLIASGGTNYSNVFRTLHDAIEADTDRLRAEGFKVYRALGFFLTDGEPNSEDRDWPGEFARQLTFEAETGQGFKRYPRFIPLGFRDASLETLSQLAYPAKGGRAFVQRNGGNVAEVFDAILPFIGNTIVATGRTGQDPTARVQHVVPPTIPGFDAQDSQYAGGDWLA